MPTIRSNSMRTPQMPCPVAPRRKSFAYRRTPDGVNKRKTTRAGEGCLIATAASESMPNRVKPQRGFDDTNRCWATKVTLSTASNSGSANVLTHATCPDLPYTTRNVNWLNWLIDFGVILPVILLLRSEKQLIFCGRQRRATWARSNTRWGPAARTTMGWRCSNQMISVNLL